MISLIEVLTRPLGDPDGALKGVMEVLEVGNELRRVDVVPVQHDEVNGASAVAFVDKIDEPGLAGWGGRWSGAAKADVARL